MRKILLALRCLLWYGEHAYKPISPEDQHGRQVGECVRCGHKKVLWFIPAVTPSRSVGEREAYAVECVVPGDIIPNESIDEVIKEQERIVLNKLKKRGVLRTEKTGIGDGVLVKTSFVVPADNFQKWIDERQRMLESAKAASELYCQKKGGSL